MIKLERTSVMNFENAVRGMRNPLNSWELSDSMLCKGRDGFEDCTINPAGVCPRHEDFSHDIFCIGKDDFKLAMKLCKAGSDHRKFMRQIFVSVDITAPLYWWKQFDTYKVGTVSNSTSTMHKIHAKEFTLDDFSHEHLWGDEYDIDYPIGVLNVVIDMLNDRREAFLEDKDKTYWYQMIQLLPSSYNQMRTCTLTYENLVNMYHARKNHKLDEWHDFCKWIETLPYSELITGGKDER